MAIYKFFFNKSFRIDINNIYMYKIHYNRSIYFKNDYHVLDDKAAGELLFGEKIRNLIAC
jgi:hypothetical protein